MNIVIPMAGLGSRFVQAGFAKPKPFIDVAGLPMIVRVMENVKYPGANFYLIARKEHLIQEKDLVAEIEQNYNAQFIGINKLTEGTACTALHARRYINNAEPLVIANSDQIVDISIQHYIDDCLNKRLDGSILTFTDHERNPKWSFARIDEDGLVAEVQEKKAISEYATVGVYFFTKGEYFVNGAIDMIVENDRVNNEFYTCPVYNYVIAEGRKICNYNISFKEMNGLGTPEDLAKYLTKKNVLK